MSSSVIDILRSYANDIHGTEKTLALVASKWIAVDPEAAKDPLLEDILSKARLHMSCGWNPAVSTAHSFDFFLSKPKSSIMDYFGGGGGTTGSGKAEIQTSERLMIYCDGACTANGRRGAKAGWGVSVMEHHREIQSISEQVPADEPQTNQRGELHALKDAMDIALKSENGADIYTDSEYAMKCLQEWAPGWAAKGWKKADKGDVLHQDLLKPMYEMWKHRGSKIRLFHVRSHTGRGDIHSKGNDRADRLAKESIEKK